MKDDSNPVRTAHGVRVFRSAVVRAAPDTASIEVAGARIEQKPEAALTKAREAAQAVNACLKSAPESGY